MNLEELFAIRNIYGLKRVERQCTVLTDKEQLRKESSAEHSWSCLVLADFLLQHFDLDIDRMRVFELLMYHDLVETYAGDVGIDDVNGRRNKFETEHKAALRFQAELNLEGHSLQFGSRFYSLFMDYEKGESQEVLFAKMVDRLDAILHELDHKKDWKGWSSLKLKSLKEKYFEPFPELHALFLKLVVFIESEGYFDQ